MLVGKIEFILSLRISIKLCTNQERKIERLWNSEVPGNNSIQIPGQHWVKDYIDRKHDHNMAHSISFSRRPYVAPVNASVCSNWSSHTVSADKLMHELNYSRLALRFLHAVIRHVSRIHCFDRWNSLFSLNVGLFWSDSKLPVGSPQAVIRQR